MRILATSGLLLLAACGKQGALEPRPGASLPPTPINTSAAPTPEQMLVPPVQAAPERIDDPVRNSRERGDDPFNLPPPGRR